MFRLVGYGAARRRGRGRDQGEYRRGPSTARGIGAPFSLPAEQGFCDDFLVFAVEWEPDAIRGSADGKQYQSVTPAGLPAGAKRVCDHPFYSPEAPRSFADHRW